MKKITGSAALLAVLSLSLLTACGGSTSTSGNTTTGQSSGSDKSQKTYTIGFANLDNTGGGPFVADVQKSMETAAKKYGVKLVEADNKLSGSVALDNARNFITQNVDGVVEFQTDEKFGNVIMNLFQQKHTPVIAIDIPMPGATFFGADNYKAGLLSGQALGKAIKEKWNGQLDKLISLDLPQSGPIPAARMQGMWDGVKQEIPTFNEDKDIIHLDSKNTLDHAKVVVTDALTSNPGLHHIGIVCINDETAMGSLDALKQAGRLNDALISSQGMDQLGQQMIRDPQDLAYIGATGYFPEKYGDYIIPAMLKLLKGESVTPSIYMDHVYIDRSNVDQYYPKK